MRIVSSLILSVIICGCGFKTPPLTPEELSAKIAGSCTSQNDDYSGTQSALLDYQFNPEGIDPIFGAPASVKLEARPSATAPYLVSISYNADNWDFLDRANEKGGKELKLSGIDKSPNRASHVLDNAYIALTRDQLARYSVSGLDFKVSASRGEAAFVIPAAAFSALQICASNSGIN